MKTTKTSVPLNINKLANQEFVQLLNDTILDVEKIMTPSPAEPDTPLKTYFTNLKNGIAPYEDATKNPAKDPYTQVQKEKDKARDVAFQNFGRRLRAFEWSNNDDEQTAFQNLIILWNTHSETPRLNYKEQTAATLNFLNDLTKEPYAAAVQTLNLTEAKNRVETTNADYIDIAADKRAEDAAKTVSDSKAMRNDLSGAYRTLTEYIFVMAKAQPDNQMWDKLLAAINVSRRRYAELVARKPTKKKKEAQDGEE